MSGAHAISTPLGDLRLSVSCEGLELGDPDSVRALPGGSLVGQWRESEGLVVDLLVVRYDNVALVLRGGPRCQCWGAEWRLHAPQSRTGSISIRSLLPDDVQGEANGDEALVMTEFNTRSWCLTVAGLDDSWYDELDHSGRLPPSWRGRFRQWSPHRGFDGVRSVDQGVTWHLPGLDAGESATAYTTVAWCPAGDRRAELAPFYAVDIRPADLLAVAGL